jgi:hypothetical protein
VTTYLEFQCHQHWSPSSPWPTPIIIQVRMNVIRINV